MQAKKILKKLLIFFFFILLWQVIAYFVNKNLLIAIPTPITVVFALVRLSKNLSFWLSAVFSLYRVLIGFLLAALTGTVLAVISNKIKIIGEFISPLLRLMRAVPVAAFIILVFLWVKEKNIPTLIAFLTVLPIIWDATYSALCSVDKTLIEMASVLGLSKGKILRFITFPAIKPAYSAALITGLGFAWKSGVAAEVISRTEISLGNLLWIGKNAIDYDEVFAVTVVIVVFSVIFEYLLKLTLKSGVAK